MCCSASTGLPHPLGDGVSLTVCIVIEYFECSWTDLMRSFPNLLLHAIGPLCLRRPGRTGHPGTCDVHTPQVQSGQVGVCQVPLWVPIIGTHKVLGGLISEYHRVA